MTFGALFRGFCFTSFTWITPYAVSISRGFVVISL